MFLWLYVYGYPLVYLVGRSIPSPLRITTFIYLVNDKDAMMRGEAVVKYRRDVKIRKIKDQPIITKLRPTIRLMADMWPPTRLCVNKEYSLAWLQNGDWVVSREKSSEREKNSEREYFKISRVFRSSQFLGVVSVSDPWLSLRSPNWCSRYSRYNCTINAFYYISLNPLSISRHI